MWPTLTRAWLLFSAVSAPAAAQESAPRPMWYLGLPLTQVSLESPSGGLEQENLAPLLRSVQGDPYDPGAVRADLRTLHAAGNFATVEAHVEPWVELDEDGEPTPAVRLIFRVQPAPTLEHIRFTGLRSLKKPEVLQAAGLRRGARFFPEEERDVVVARLEAWCQEQGFPYARVDLEIERDEDDPTALTLTIALDEGEPRILGGLSFAGDGVLSERRLRRLARRHKVRVGRRYTDDAVAELLRTVKQEVRDEGWSRARVRSVYLPSAAGDQLSIFVDAGVRVEVKRQGRQLPRRGLEELLQVSQERRFSETWRAEAGERVKDNLRERGWLDAEVELEATLEGDVHRVVVRADAGTRYRLARRGLRFKGAAALSEGTLTAAMEQASPEVIGKGRATPEVVERALRDVQDVYRSRGYLEASLAVVESERRGRRLYYTIQVEEGDQTLLERLRVVGQVPEPSVQAVIDEAAAAMVGQPLNPAALQRLQRQLSEAHRSLGYLAVDTTSRTEVEGQRARVVLEVTPGVQQRLRNVIVRGLRRTKREVVEREVTLATGEPITPEALSEVRSDLYELGVFSSVTTDLTGDDLRARDLLISVQERPVVAVEFGVGASTDQGARTFAQVTRRNLLGSAHSLQGLGQVGVGYVGDTWVPDTTALEWRAALRYQAPHVPRQNQTLTADVLLNEQELEPTYRINAMGGGVGVSSALSDTTRVALDYRARWVELEDIDPGALVKGDPWLEIFGVEDPTTESLSYPSGFRRQTGIGLVFVADRRDDRFNPTRGSFFSLTLDAWDQVFSAYTGGKVLGSGGAIRPLGPLSLRLSGQAGAGFITGGVRTLPADERFRLGGPSTLRGYPLDSVGPKNNVTDQVLDWPDALEPMVEYLGRDETDRWVSTGGDASLQASLELWVPLSLVGLDTSESTALVTFVDVGNTYFIAEGVYADVQPCSFLEPAVYSRDPSCTVFAVPDDDRVEPALRYGVGVGFRLGTPVGPIQLDLGFNPLYYQADWAAERGEVPARFHLSLGAL
jgi:outer membrane protein insertion porin family